MTVKAEIENLSIFGTAKNVYFFMGARSIGMVNFSGRSLHSISLSRATCKHDFGYWIVLTAAHIINSGQVLEPLQEKKPQTHDLCFWTCQKVNKIPSSCNLL